MKRFLQEYKLELFAIGVILIGVFLVLDRFVRGILLEGVTSVFNAVWSVLDRWLTWLANRLAGLTPAEFLGGVLIVGAVILLVWRIRCRFQTGHKWGSIVCPVCSSPIRRVHRHWWDRLLGATLLPEARRYRCVNPECRWSGLRRRNILPHHQPSQEQSQPLP